MSDRIKFTEPRFILTEGEEDAAFLRALIEARNTPKFDVSPVIDLGKIGGNSGFEAAVIACGPTIGFSAVKEIVIIADNDDDPAKLFANVTGQIEKAREEGNLTRNWGKATKPGVKAKGDPSVSIWMWPSANQSGCLETLFWPVIQLKYPKEAACVQTACECTGADKWPVSKLDKARVRCFLSIYCRRNPAQGLGPLWRDQPNLIPLNRSEFNPISRFLAAI